MRQLVESLQKRDRFQILISPVFVRNPLPLFPGVVQIEHRRNCIHPEPVHMKTVQPVQRTADQKAAHLVASEIENIRSPVLLLSLPRIRMLVQRGPVEAPERKGVFRKMGRHPVQNHADSQRMHMIHKIGEILRCPEPGGRRIEPRHLIPPRLVQRMLADREKFHMRVAHVQHILSERMGQLAGSC